MIPDIKRILYTTDLSQNAAHAFRYAISFSKKFDAEIVLLHVLEELSEDARIVLEAYAKLGIGETHAKWQPVATCSYKYLPLIKIDYERCEKCERCVDVCPRHILSFKNDQVHIPDLKNDLISWG